MSKKRKLVYVVYGENAIHGKFDTQAEASAFAQAHNLENNNWKSIDTKWWMTSHPADQPITL